MELTLTEEEYAVIEDTLLEELNGCDCKRCELVRRLLDHARATLDTCRDGW